MSKCSLHINIIIMNELIISLTYYYKFKVIFELSVVEVQETAIMKRHMIRMAAQK